LWSWGDEEVVAQTLATGARKVVLKDAADARYLPTGHLVFMRRGVLFAVPFDTENLAARGAPVAVLDTVAQALTAGDTADITGAGQAAVSANGNLAWVPGSVVPYPDAMLVSVDRRGQVHPLPAPVRSYGPALRLSPDGRRLVVTVRTLGEIGLWVYDLDRRTLSPLTQDGEATFAVWAPDGRRLVFAWFANGRPALASQPADGTAPPKELLPGPFHPSSFTPDGRHLAVVREETDIMAVTVEDGQAQARRLTESPAREQFPEVSPDGRWLAYSSNVSRRTEVYARPYSAPGPAALVSLEGGENPAWHPNGRELFFVSLPDPAGKRRMMAVEFAPGSPPRIGSPRPLFTFDCPDLNFCCYPTRCWDVTPDGQRFYVRQMQTRPPSPPVTHIQLILNWFEELKAKVPSGTR